LSQFSGKVSVGWDCRAANLTTVQISEVVAMVVSFDRFRRWETSCAPERSLPLVTAELVAGVSAIGGGIGLLLDRIGMTPEALEHTPFSSFTIPALVLIGVVGSSQLGAAWLVWQRHRLAAPASLAAGGILLGWIVVEAAMVRVPGSRPLQIVVFALAVMILSFARRLLVELDCDSDCN
jgi:hypothetical protein